MTDYTDMNPEEQLAWQIVETTNTHLFLTGKAGTGKTTFLRKLREKSLKRMVVVAPTGIAAINASGVTMHSFFQLPFAPYLPDTTLRQSQSRYRFSREKIKIIRAIDLLVIDEISMVRADLLDAVSDVLCRHRRSRIPFGGVQLVMIGDLGQLAPVAKPEEWQMLSRFYDSPYFFSSRALMKTDFAVVELKHVYRQSDAHFIDLLSRVRDNQATRETLAELNSRYIPGFRPAASEGYIRLTTHNAQAKEKNDEEMAKLPEQSYTYTATVEGDFPEYSFPIEERLVLKKGAQVMFVKNDSSPEKRYYNGMIGTVTEISCESLTVRPKDGGEEIEVGQEEWENCRYAVDEETKEIREVMEGRFRQIPLKPAWAITIHKSQGLTFDKAIIDAASSFAHGQTYVALSRCRTLEGMVLSSPLPASAIINDSVVDDFTASVADRCPSADILRQMQRRYFMALLDELFDFNEINSLLFSMKNIVSENFGSLYQKEADDYAELCKNIVAEVLPVAEKFRSQRSRMAREAADSVNDDELQNRLRRGAGYFSEVLKKPERMAKSDVLHTENAALRKRTANTLDSLRDVLHVKRMLLDYVATNGFGIENYLRQKSEIILGGQKKPVSEEPLKKMKDWNGCPTQNTGLLRLDILKPSGKVLFNRLRTFRTELASEEGVPPYLVFSDKTLIDICIKLPADRDEMLEVYGVGMLKFDKYGQKFLDKIKEFTGGKKRKLYFDEMSEVQASLDSRKRRQAKVEFSLTKEQIQDFPYEGSILIAHLAEKMNALRNPDEMKKISGAEIFRWLQSEGYADEQYIDGSWTRIVSEKGAAAGLSLAPRTSAKGTEYMDIYYNRSAQEMILKHYTNEKAYTSFAPKNYTLEK